jgi:hypothetical protein
VNASFPTTHDFAPFCTIITCFHRASLANDPAPKQMRDRSLRDLVVKELLAITIRSNPHIISIKIHYLFGCSHLSLFQALGAGNPLGRAAQARRLKDSVAARRMEIDLLIRPPRSVLLF